MSGKHRSTTASRKGRGAAPAIAIGLAALLVAGCSSQSRYSAKPKPKEYFAESEYGVKASPRVTDKVARLPRGGGREQVGKPYRVKDVWYHPKEVAAYSKVGKASWYGDAFHGRLTANGEIYDMTHLTAAHPTLPLPSYARVTNLKNGSSVVVRVNDRGPFAHGRIIDLSRRAAELLDYTHQGVAEVKVDYLGKAPLHGRDDEYLMASYRPRGAPAESDAVMVAMSGSTPDRPGRSIPDIIADNGGTIGMDLPEYGPVPSVNPLVVAARLALRERMGAASAYAATASASPAGAALERLARRSLTVEAVVNSWNRRTGTQQGEATVHIGTFEDANAARSLAEQLGAFGTADLKGGARGEPYTLTMRIDSDLEDPLLRKAWSLGAKDAFPIRQ